MKFSNLQERLYKFIENCSKEPFNSIYGCGNHGNYANISSPFLQKDYGNIKVFSIYFDFPKGGVPKDKYYFTVNSNDEILTIHNAVSYYQTLDEFLWSAAFVYGVSYELLKGFIYKEQVDVV